MIPSLETGRMWAKPVRREDDGQVQKIFPQGRRYPTADGSGLPDNCRIARHSGTSAEATKRTTSTVRLPLLLQHDCFLLDS